MSDSHRSRRDRRCLRCARGEVRVKSHCAVPEDNKTTVQRTAREVTLSILFDQNGFAVRILDVSK
jgi:hypothetical protein